MLKPVTLVVSLGAALLGGTASAAAQQTPPSSDPSQGSPSGTVYELPVDSARLDAAPRSSRPRGGDGSGKPKSGSGAAGDSTAGDAQSARKSPIRSENGFGSSTQVPGVGEGAADASGTGGDAAKGGSEGGGDASSSAGSGSGSGSGTSDSSAEGSERSGAPQSTVRLSSTAPTDPSGARVYGIVGLGILLALAVAFAGRAARRRV